MSVTTRSEAAVAENATLVKEEIAEEQPPMYHQLQPVPASRGEGALSALSLGLEEDEAEEEQEEMLIVSDKIRTLQAVSARKAEHVAKLSVLEQRKLKLRQELEQVERDEDEVQEELRALTSQEMRSLAPERVDALQEASRAPKRKAGSVSFLQGTPKRAKMQLGKASVTFKQLCDYVDDMKQQGMRGEKTLPYRSCGPPLRAPADEGALLLQVPVRWDDYRTVRLDKLKEHVATRAHNNAAWTDDMNARCVVQENLDCYRELCR